MEYTHISTTWCLRQGVNIQHEKMGNTWGHAEDLPVLYEFNCSWHCYLGNKKKYEQTSKLWLHNAQILQSL